MYLVGLARARQAYPWRQRLVTLNSELWQVPDAAGGMGFVLQLSHAGDDPEGWSAQERSTYDGWGHDQASKP